MPAAAQGDHVTVDGVGIPVGIQELYRTGHELRP